VTESPEEQLYHFSFLVQLLSLAFFIQLSLNLFICIQDRFDSLRSNYNFSCFLYNIKIFGRKIIATAFNIEEFVEQHAESNLPNIYWTYTTANQHYSVLLTQSPQFFC
jgi:hypothetical protein